MRNPEIISIKGARLHKPEADKNIILSDLYDSLKNPVYSSFWIDWIKKNITKIFNFDLWDINKLKILYEMKHWKVIINNYSWDNLKNDDFKKALEQLCKLNSLEIFVTKTANQYLSKTPYFYDQYLRI